MRAAYRCQSMYKYIYVYIYAHTQKNLRWHRFNIYMYIRCIQGNLYIYIHVCILNDPMYFYSYMHERI